MADRKSGFSRAGFLKAGAAAAATVGAGKVTGTAAAARPATGDRLAYLRLATYTPLLGSQFTIRHPHGPIPARLAELSPFTARAARERKHRECFSLVFDAGRGEQVSQGNYTLEHPALGTFTLFLVPVGRGQKGIHLEAIVNRFVE